MEKIVATLPFSLGLNRPAETLENLDSFVKYEAKVSTRSLFRRIISPFIYLKTVKASFNYSLNFNLNLSLLDLSRSF